MFILIQMKTIHFSKLPKLKQNGVRYNNGMEVLLCDGWYKVIFEAYLYHAVSENKN